uniref:Putative splicing factor n=1 Tax=Culex tarsalis TaxID=7177 RepID=A0A1Q3F7F7_CULTA
MQRNKIFVGSLPPQTKPEEIRAMFENYGVVTECDVMNRCAFVHMQSSDMAENAIAALHNSTFKGATINVEHGRSKNPGDGGGRGEGGFRGGPRGAGGGRGGFRQDGQDRSGAGGPMRNNRGGFRNQPYGGGGGRGGYEGGNYRGGYNRGGGGGGGSAGGDNYRNSGHGSRFSQASPGQFNSEDRRGFALPNEGGGAGRYGAGPGANHHHSGGLAISAQNDPYARRAPPPAVGGGGGGPGYGGRGGYNQGNGTGSFHGSNYNQAFPPLGSEPPRVNRGPPPPQHQQRWAQ